MVKMKMTMRHLRTPETRAAARQMRKRRNATLIITIVNGHGEDDQNIIGDNKEDDADRTKKG